MAKGRRRGRNRKRSTKRAKQHRHHWTWSKGPDGSLFRTCQTPYCLRSDTRTEGKVTVTKVTPADALAMIQGSKS